MKKLYFTFITFLIPIFVFAQNRWTQGLFPCKTPPDCSFGDLISLAQGIAAALVRVGIILAPFLLMYIGYLYLTSQDNPSQRSQANKLAKNAVIGFAIMLSAYVIVKLVLLALLDPTVLQDVPFDTQS